MNTTTLKSREEYISLITELLDDCQDLELLDLVVMIIQKSM